MQYLRTLQDYIPDTFPYFTMILPGLSFLTGLKIDLQWKLPIRGLYPQQNYRINLYSDRKR